MDTSKRMTRKEMHEALDESLDRMQGKPVGFMYCIVADIEENREKGNDTECQLVGRNVDPRLPVYSILCNLRDEGGNEHMFTQLNDVLGKIMPGVAPILGSLRVDNMPPEVKEMLKGLMGALGKGLKSDDAPRPQPRKKEREDEDVELPPQAPPRQK